MLNRRAREDLRVANQRINTILADYGDVVPRREYEVLESSYKVWKQLQYTSDTYTHCDVIGNMQTLEEEVESLKKDHTNLMQEHK